MRVVTHLGLCIITYQAHKRASVMDYPPPWLPSITDEIDLSNAYTNEWNWDK
jgi:hypothetical protein